MQSPANSDTRSEYATAVAPGAGPGVGVGVGVGDGVVVVVVGLATGAVAAWEGPSGTPFEHAIQVATNPPATASPSERVQMDIISS